MKFKLDFSDLAQAFDSVLRDQVCWFLFLLLVFHAEDADQSEEGEFTMVAGWPMK